MKKKKLLLLGGLKYLIPVIKEAKELGIYVITCDNIPDNYAHQYSDEYHNVSIIDANKVLALAKDLKIDGIMSFAVDPGVLTASYVAEKLGLPGISYEAAKILQNKALFREFLNKNGFNTPKARGFNSKNIDKDLLTDFNLPIIVKPVDSAGSKGVTRIDNIRDLDIAIKFAISNSFSGNYIIEEFIEQKGFSSDSDCFSINGKMEFISFSNQRFDTKAKNPYTPSGFSWPSSLKAESQLLLKSELQRLADLLSLGTSIYNVEVRESIAGKPYIMEVSPRGGGNRIAEVLRYSTGINLIKNSVLAAIGQSNLDFRQIDYNGYWAEIILHTNIKGIFKGLEIDKYLRKNNLIEVDLWARNGDLVEEFSGANNSLGTLILRFETQGQLEEFFDNSDRLIKVIVS